MRKRPEIEVRRPSFAGEEDRLDVLVERHFASSEECVRSQQTRPFAWFSLVMPVGRNQQTSQSVLSIQRRRQGGAVVVAGALRMALLKVDIRSAPQGELQEFWRQTA
jgi:hypothetical protein